MPAAPTLNRRARRALASEARRHAPAPAPTAVALVESYPVGKARVDRDAGIIFGVKLCGRYSPNCHGHPQITEGTEYTRDALRNAARLYEGVKVYPNHAPRNKPGHERDVFESIGAVKDVRYDDAGDCLRGDLHYNRQHPKAAQLVEDAERGLNGFGFSHHIPPGGYTSRVHNGRLLIESITRVKSVDLVSDPATTSNLFESAEQPTVKTFKAILEAWVAKKSPAFKAVAKPLFEDGEMMGATVDAPGDGSASDPEDELWAGFQSAIVAIINGDGTAEEKAKKVRDYLKAHEKLTGDKDPGPDDTETETSADDAADTDKKESRELRAENACLKAGIKDPPKALLKALGLLESQAERDELIAQYKPQAGTTTTTQHKPKSGAPGKRPGGQGGALSESKVPTGADFKRSICG